MRTLTLAYCTLSLARIMAMDSDDDMRTYAPPYWFESVELDCNRSGDFCGIEKPYSNQPVHKTVARKVKDLLLEGKLPKDLFIQCVNQKYKLPSLKQIGTLLRLQILHKKISQADFEQFAEHHKQYAWDSEIDEKIKYYIESWYTRSYASIKPGASHSARFSSSRNHIKRVSKKGLPLDKKTPEELFKKASVPTCKRLIREKHYFPNIFNVISKKKSRNGHEPLKGETMISFALLVQKHFTLEQLKAIDQHLKAHPLPENINSHIVAIVQEPIIAHEARINQEVTI